MNKDRVLVVLLILGFLVDALSKKLSIDGIQTMIPLIYRIAIMMYIIGVSRLRLNSKDIAFALLIIADFFCFTFLSYSGEMYLFRTKITLVLLSVVMLRKLVIRKPQIVTEVYVLFLAINGLIAIVGMLLGIEWLRMEPESERFGFTGILPTSGNELSYLMVTALFYELSRKRRNVSMDFVIKVMLIIGAIISGLKAVYLGLVLIVLYYLWKRTMFIVPMLVYSALIVVNNIVYLEKTFSYFIFMYDKYGLIHMLTSGRFNRVVDYFSFSEIILPNFIETVNFEMDFLTLLYNYGIVGFIGFIVLYSHYKWRIKSGVLKLYSSWLFIVMVFAGHLIESAYLIVPLTAFSQTVRKYHA